LGYDWEDLLFIEVWRLRAARGMLVGAWSEDGRILMTLRLHHEASWHPSRPLTFVDIEAVDVGNVLREKPHRLLDHFSVLLRASPAEVARPGRVERSHPLLPASEAPTGPAAERRRVGRGARLAGVVTEVGTEGTLLVDVGFPVLLRGATDFGPRDPVQFRLPDLFEALLL